MALYFVAVSLAVLLLYRYITVFREERALQISKTRGTIEKNDSTEKVATMETTI